MTARYELILADQVLLDRIKQALALREPQHAPLRAPLDNSILGTLSRIQCAFDRMLNANEALPYKHVRYDGYYRLHFRLCTRLFGGDLGVYVSGHMHDTFDDVVSTVLKLAHS